MRHDRTNSSIRGTPVMTRLMEEHSPGTLVFMVPGSHLDRPRQAEQPVSSTGAMPARIEACDLPLVPPGFAPAATERTLEGAGPASTWVSMRFDDGMGRPIGDEHVVSRCVPAQG